MTTGTAEPGHPTTTSRPIQTRSLRSQWNRSFLLLTTIVMLTGLASFIGTRLLVDTFRSSAVRMEHEATTNTELRADIVTDSVLMTSADLAAGQGQLDAIRARIRSSFTQSWLSQHTAAARDLLDQSRAQWEQMDAAAGPPDQPTDVIARGTAVSVGAPKVLALLDQAGSASRAGIRAELAGATAVERESTAVLALLELAAIGLAVRLSRRLSTEVLRPVGDLRDSANQLAAGKLDHRVMVDRADELGELATSFNAMADAISGTQRSLTLEATTDSLSGLANRAAFRGHLQRVLARPDRRSGGQAVLFVDLDDFKDVNDTLGHAAGDELLRVVAIRLGGAVRPGDLVARLGGDEFALLLDGLPDGELAYTVAQRVVTALAEPVQLGTKWAHVGASVGLAPRQPDSTFESLMREADVAMYAAKGKGKNRVERFDAAVDEVSTARLLLRAEVGTATGRGELVLDYQPVVDLQTGSIVGLEALVRWQHPSRGLLPPSAFIDLAEETGAIIGIGAWVLETAARQLLHWQRRYGLPALWLSVNVSVGQLDQPGYADTITELCRATGLDPGCLVLEVTESMMADPEGGAAAALTSLRRSGVRVALDDFGTGYSSIGYLRQLPVDILKVDRSFVAGTFTAAPDYDLLEAIVAMAQRLHLDVIPEGIEEPDQLLRLRVMGCHVGQGFLLSRPGSTEAIEALLAAPMPLPHVGLSERGDPGAVPAQPGPVEVEAAPHPVP
jgi:diguanylate cyclase (GGDEF)-like protein